MQETIDPPVAHRFSLLLGMAIRAMRKRRGLSQERLAQRADTTRETVRRIEIGIGTTTAMVDRLVDAMEYTGDDLHEELRALRVLFQGHPPRSPRKGRVVPPMSETWAAVG